MSAERRVRVLFEEATIARRTTELAEAIAAGKPRNLLVVAILRGSFMFAADLIRALHRVGLEPQVEFMHLSSYREGTTSSGRVTILKDVDSVVSGRDVLLIDDILEFGRTLAFAKDLLAARGAASVKVCVMLEKPGKRAVQIAADFVGFHCPDLFVVGYGWMLPTLTDNCPSLASSKNNRTRLLTGGLEPGSWLRRGGGADPEQIIAKSFTGFYSQLV